MGRSHRMEVKASLFSFLIFFASMGAVWLEIFRDALFLSTYPPSYLPYFFGAQALLSFLLIIPIEALYRKKGKFYHLSILGLMLGLCATFAWVFNDRSWFPFAFALFLTPVSTLILMGAYFGASSLLPLDQAKTTNRHFAASGGLGIVVGALSVLGWTFIFQSIQPLLWAGLVLSFAVWLFLGFEEDIRGKVKGKPLSLKEDVLSRYPLLKILFPMAAIAGTLLLFGKYLLSYQLSLAFSPTSIAQFLAGIFATVHLMLYGCHTFLEERMISRLGLTKFLVAAPVLIFLGTAAFLMHPSLGFTAGYFGIIYFANELFLQRGLALAASPLPSQVCVYSAYVENRIFKEGGIFLGSLVALAASVYLTTFHGILTILALTAALLTVAWSFLALKVKKRYLQALESAVTSRSFAMDTQGYDLSSLSFLEKIANKILHSENTRLYSLACNLLAKVPALSKEDVDLLIEKIKLGDAAFALQALQFLDRKHVPIPNEFIVEIFHKEKNPEILWALTEMLSHKKTKEILPVASKLLDSGKETPKTVYAALLLGSMGTLPLIQKSYGFIQRALKSKDPEVRRACARILGSLPVGDCREELKKMILDPEADISIQGIQSASKRKYFDLFPVIISKLGTKQVSYYASYALKDFGEIAVPQLSALAANGEYSVAYPAIRTIAAISSPVATQALLELASHPSCMIKTWTARFLFRAARSKKMSYHFDSIYRLIQREASKRSLFKRAMKGKLPSYVQKELAIQLEHATLRCLCWYGVYTNPKETHRPISLLLSLHPADKGFMRKREAYLEKLATYTEDPKLRKILQEWDHEEALQDADFALCAKEDKYLNMLMETSLQVS